MTRTIVLTAKLPNGQIITFNLYGEVTPERHEAEYQILKHRVNQLS